MNWHCRDRIFDCARPVIMGILNVTPDSFSDGGRFHDTSRAIAAGMKMFEDGADIVDVGGESSRPGAVPVSQQEEIDRVAPVIEALAGRENRAVSVDTVKSAVAREAIRAGACAINDISAMTADPAMAALAAEHRTGAVLMHMRETPQTMQNDPRYGNVSAEVHAYLSARAGSVMENGVGKECIAIDPGIGFGKTFEHNMTLLANLDMLVSLGMPVAVGLSRKSFLATITGQSIENRLAGSLGAMVFSLVKGASIFRAHDVRASRDAADTAAALIKKGK